MNDIFYFIKDASIASYADDTTPYATNKHLSKLLDTLKQETNLLLKWFTLNEMKPNADKCHLMITNSIYTSVKLDNEKITNEPYVDLLGVQIDETLKFKEHVTKLCKKGNQKLHALARIAKYIQKDKLKLLMKSFVISQFNCLLIWMFHNRTLNNKINRLHERALRIVYPNTNLTFEE